MAMYASHLFISRRLGLEAGKIFPKMARIRPIRRNISAQVEESVTKKESPKSWRENPNLKYWVVGVCAISGIIYRYVYKEKDKRKVIVKNFPALPSHKLQSRDSDLNELYKLCKNGSSVKTVHVEGHSGSGKTLLATALAKKLAKEEEERYHFLPKNLFVGTINGVNLDALLFDIKKFAVAIGCQSKDWLLRIDEGTKFGNLSDSEQLHIITQAVKEKLIENPNWILIFDDLRDYEFLQKVFGDDLDSWGKGTVIITSTLKLRTDLNNSYCLDKGMDKQEAVDLLKQLTELPEDKLEVESDQILDKLAYSPLAIACAGTFIKSRLATNNDYSLKDFTDEFSGGLEQLLKSNPTSNMSEGIKSSYVISSLLVKETLNVSPHFLHSFDLIGSCSPVWPIPVSLISLHLRSAEYHLPPVPRSSSVLPDHPDQGEIKPVKPEEEVEETLFSIKRLANNLESFTKAVKANYDAIKEMFNPTPLDFSPPSDGVLELMQTCPFVSSEKVNPGGVQTIKVNSIVHEVMSQLFTSTTCQILEDQHLIQAEEKHNNSSWFRRLWAFDPQRSLQEFRNSLIERDRNVNPSQGSPNQDDPKVNSGIDVSCLLRDDRDYTAVSSYRRIQSQVASEHYQRHIGLVLKTMNGVSSVCSQDVQTRTLARLIMPHLHHTLTANTSKNLEPKSRAHALLAVSSINSALGNLEASIPSLEQALAIEEEQFGVMSLEVASTLTRLAEVYSSLDDAPKARVLLERAYGIYEQQRKKAGEYKKPLEFARTMEALGAVYGALGFKQQSKDYIERALSYMQSAAPTTPDEIEGRRFTCEVASTLADLGHAYLSIGDAFSGRKMLELAVTGLKNMYGEEHPEVVRALTILGTAYTMQGNWQEGKKMRKEAGKLQAKLDTVVAL